LNHARSHRAVSYRCAGRARWWLSDLSLRALDFGHTGSPGAPSLTVSRASVFPFQQSARLERDDPKRLRIGSLHLSGVREDISGSSEVIREFECRIRERDKIGDLQIRRTRLHFSTLLGAIGVPRELKARLGLRFPSKEELHELSHHHSHRPDHRSARWV
jgi:hypothetical protein